MGIIDRSLSLGNRERMIRTCLNQDIDRQPFWFMFGPWSETLDRWRKEGFDGDWRAVFGLDVGFQALPVRLGLCPFFERLVIEENEEKCTVRNEHGITYTFKKGVVSIPSYLDYPVKNFNDWEELKRERLNPHAPERFPQNLPEVIDGMKKRDAAIQIGGYPYGLFGTARDLMGAEELLISFYDSPELVHDIMDYLTDFWLKIYEKALDYVQIDHIHIWEDMSGKTGPLISPAMFKEFMLPNYQKIVSFAKQKGIPVVSVDTDWNMDEMMPLLEESGINFVLPFEVQAGCDIVSYKLKHPGISIHGGIDKLRLEKGFEEIDEELRRVADMFKASGYIAGLDHLVHPDISFENFSYFIKRLKENVFPR